MKKTKLKLKKKYVITLIVLFVLSSILIMSNTTYGRYVIERIRDSYLTSRKFYFISKSVNDKTYDLYNYDGISTYSLPIDIANNIDDLNWTKQDINYTVTLTCSDNVNCSHNASGTLLFNNNQITKENFIVSIIPKNSSLNEEEVVNVNIKINSTSPYTKELNATFRIHVTKFNLNYYIIDDGNQKYFDLIIENNTINNKNLTLSFDSSIINYDNTNDVPNSDLILTNGVVSGLNISVNSNSIKTIRLFKTIISNDYTYPIINDTSIVSVTEN